MINTLENTPGWRALENLNWDVWAILIAKSGAKSDADDKIKGVAQGKGFWAYL